MKVIGLTGSIGMGKSVLAGQFKRLRVPVHESDAVVHALLGVGGLAVPAIARAFPTVVKNGIVDRKALGALVFNDPKKRRMLEGILHPLVRASSRAFLKGARRRGHKIAVLDIPLLFETRQEGRCHMIICVTAPYFVQTRRVLKRPHMTEDKLRRILKLQWPDAVKRRRATDVINTARGLRGSLAGAKRVIARARRS